MEEIKRPPVKPDKIADLVEAVKGAVKAAEDIYAAVGRFESCVYHFKGKSAYSRFNIYRWDNIDRMTKLIHADGWKCLLERFEPFMSVSERNEWEREIEKGNVPEFTEQAAIETMRSFIERTPENSIKRIQECFESIRPRFREDLKTNQANAFKISKRHIHRSAFRSHYPTSHGERFFAGLDLAFHLLDGKGVPKHPNDSVTIIRTAMRDGMDKVETEYFKFKWYGNGNVHIEFKRPDLVSELNRIGSNGKAELDKGKLNVE